MVEILGDRVGRGGGGVEESKKENIFLQRQIFGSNFSSSVVHFILNRFWKTNLDNTCHPGSKLKKCALTSIGFHQL